MNGTFELCTEKEAFFNCAFLAALANGNSVVHGVNAAPDFFAFADYLRELGATVNINEKQWEIAGVNLKCEKEINLDWVGKDLPHQKRNKKIIECLLGGTPFYCEEKIAVKTSLIRELSTLGAELEWKLEEGYDENDELARRMAKMQGIKNERKWICRIPPVPNLLARDRFIAGDVTQAAFLALSATITPGSDITIKTVSLDSSRAGIFNALKRLGADIEIIARTERGNEVFGDLRVKTSRTLIGKRFNADALSTCIDEIPMLAVLACFAEDETILKLPSWATDYCKPVLATLYENFKTAGIECGLYEEGFIIRGKNEMEPEIIGCIEGLYSKILNKVESGEWRVES